MSAPFEERLNDSLKIATEILVDFRSQEGELFEISNELKAVIGKNTR